MPLWEQHEEDTVDGVRAKSCDLSCPLELAGRQEPRPPTACSSRGASFLSISLRFMPCPPRSRPSSCQAPRWLVPAPSLLTGQRRIISFHPSIPTSHKMGVELLLQLGDVHQRRGWKTLFHGKPFF